MPQSQARILSNLPLPVVDGYAVKLFRDYLPDGKRREEWRSESERRGLAEILPLIPAAEKPDILLFASPEYLPIPADIQSFPGLKILLITDWNMCLRFLPDLCPLFDLCYTDWPGYRLLKGAGVANVRHQPLFGHDPERFRVTGKLRDLDVSFCGNLNAGLHGERNRLIARIAKWGAHAPAGTGTGRAIHLRQAFGGDYVDILNRSRLVFNYSIRGEANMRLFESMACGAVPLVEESNQEAALLFQEGRHFFRYAPDRLEKTIDSLLADPARLESVSAAAREAVGRYTKAEQMRALLADAGRAVPGRPASEPAKAEGARALIKLRVLGAGYTMADALEELRARAPEHPGLETETLPGSLLTVLMRESQTALPAVERAFERHLQDTAFPEVLRAFLGMKLDMIRARWRAAAEKADDCLRALEALDKASGPVRRLYGYFHPPLDLGQGMNADLNRAFARDLAEGKPTGYCDLLRAHCRADKARAGLALGSGGEPPDLAGNAAPGRLASIDPFAALLEDRIGRGDAGGARAILRLWFAERPLDVAAWEAIRAGYAAVGDRAGLKAFLDEIAALAKAVLGEGHPVSAGLRPSL